jgi:hypothetical protein
MVGVFLEIKHEIDLIISWFEGGASPHQPNCAAGEKPDGDHCVPIPCGPGLIRGANGECTKPADTPLPPSRPDCAAGEKRDGDRCVPIQCAPGLIRGINGECTKPTAPPPPPPGPICARWEKLEGDHCVPIPCELGFVRNAKGRCEWDSTARSSSESNQITDFDGYYYSPVYRYGFHIVGDVGTATFTNSPQYEVGKPMLRFRMTGRGTFEGQQLFVDGAPHPVTGARAGNGSLYITSKQGGSVLTWEMVRTEGPRVVDK